MKFNVAQLLKEEIGSEREYEVKGESEEGYPVRGKVKLLKTDKSILVKGDIETKVKLVCSRCLETFELPLSFHIEEEFFPKVDINTGEFIYKGEEFFIDEANILDLSEVIRQYIILSIPLSPVCSESCKGLCPVCGTNLNEKECGCDRSRRGAYWDKLREFFKEA